MAKGMIASEAEHKNEDDDEEEEEGEFSTVRLKWWWLREDSVGEWDRLGGVSVILLGGIWWDWESEGCWEMGFSWILNWV